jgi:hypothetical protein
MKAAIIAGCVVLSVLVTVSGAHAAEKATTLPPVEFDKPFTGILEIVRIRNQQEIELACKASPRHACAWRQADGARCTIFMLPNEQLRSRGKNAVAFILRHELGHCNGWPGDHKGGRDVLEQFRHGHVAMPTMPPVVKELPVYPPVVCVTPDWKQEPCKNRNVVPTPVVAEPTYKVLKVKPVVPQ